MELALFEVSYLPNKPSHKPALELEIVFFFTD